MSGVSVCVPVAQRANLNSVDVNAVQASGAFTAQTTQVEPVPAPTYYPVYQPASFDIGQIMQLMMQMFQMVLMIVFLLLPIKMLPELLSSIKGT